MIKIEIDAACIVASMSGRAIRVEIRDDGQLNHSIGLRIILLTKCLESLSRFSLISVLSSHDEHPQSS